MGWCSGLVVKYGTMQRDAIGSIYEIYVYIFIAKSVLN